MDFFRLSKMSRPEAEEKAVYEADVKGCRAGRLTGQWLAAMASKAFSAGFNILEKLCFPTNMIMKVFLLVYSLPV